MSCKPYMVQLPRCVDERTSTAMCRSVRSCGVGVLMDMACLCMGFHGETPAVLPAVASFRVFKPSVELDALVLCTSPPAAVCRMQTAG